MSYCEGCRYPGEGPHDPDCWEFVMDRCHEEGPTDEDYCAAGGHGWYGDDGPVAPGFEWVGRCYCGSRLWPPGGPDRSGLAAFAASVAWAEAVTR